ncbi:uncharacterized protein LOC135715321 [Ochlerotatus camptorhynchus]|uniref:uncharacterized protein LOC135715321 n=1 Tax=Ochlerotatus camptorhynchus TaxID=644619 RepID=UPI0031DED317
MAQHDSHYRKRTLDFGDKNRNLLKFTTDVEHFLEEYDRVVEHRCVYRRNFARHLQEIETNLQLLISKFHRIGIDGCRNQLFMELFCCGTLFENRNELRKHYFRFHNTPRLVHSSIVELGSGFGKMEHFRKRLEEYLHYGKEHSAVLLVNLQKLLKNVSRTIELDRPVKDNGSTKPDHLIYRWRDFRIPIERSVVYFCKC